MILQHLSLTNFKNIAETSLDFSPGVNCFLGNNGMGKSNLLDAIYSLSFCKSFTGVNDAMLIRRGSDIAMLQASYLRREVVEKLSLGLARGRRKSLKRQGKEYQRLSQHIGVFPLVMVAPADMDLITGSGEERRRWMDMVISQSNPRYLDALIRYNALLQQRNKLLRDGVVDHNLYVAIEIPMVVAAEYIHSARTKWIDELQGIVTRYYRAIADNDETVTLEYSSRLSSPRLSPGALFDEARRHDEMVKHTTVGPHRDDIVLGLDGMPVRRTGSQGQCKTLTIALRLAQYDFLRSTAGLKPMLLLDDIFDKLDARRVEQIMSLVTDSDRFGQIFITDTNRKHLDEIISRTGGDHRLWDVNEGSFSPLS